jgi:hypothetical protein
MRVTYPDVMFQINKFLALHLDQLVDEFYELSTFTFSSPVAGVADGKGDFCET